MGFKMDDTSAEYYRAPVISTAPHTETHWYLQGRIPLYCYFNDFTGQVSIRMIILVIAVKGLLFRCEGYGKC